MPVKQQYFIAIAIIGLIAVMVLFGIFDYRSDQSRSAEQWSARQRNLAGTAAVMPYMGGGLNSQCLNCGWRGACPRGWLCPNCACPLRNANAATQTGVFNAPGSAQAAPLPPNSRCFNCGWGGDRPANWPCPNCGCPLRASNIGAGAVMAGPTGGAQNAAFLWSPQPEAVPTTPRRALYCPSCSFAMNSNHWVVSDTIRCPRCPAYLVGPASSAGPGQTYGPDASSIAAPGNVAAGQQAAFGLGYGRGYNPACPYPAQR